ncbi:hypothetical protein J6590_092433 [Homalodisca vitripennis]|nr:hypothetical protein J6590_092433 [Homalodisca vitripennis]
MERSDNERPVTSNSESDLEIGQEVEELLIALGSLDLFQRIPMMANNGGNEIK